MQTAPFKKRDITVYFTIIPLHHQGYFVVFFKRCKMGCPSAQKKVSAGREGLKKKKSTHLSCQLCYGAATGPGAPRQWCHIHQSRDATANHWPQCSLSLWLAAASRDQWTWCHQPFRPADTLFFKLMDKTFKRSKSLSLSLKGYLHLRCLIGTS